MRKVFVIARREYLAHVATKAFIISLVLVPILAVGGIFVQKLVKDRSESGEKTMLVLDGTGELLPLLQIAAKEYNERDTIDKKTGKQNSSRYILEAGPSGEVTDEVRLELSERVRKNDVFAFVEIPADLLTAPAGQFREMSFFAEKLDVGWARRWFERMLQRAVIVQRLRKSGVDPAAVAQSQVAMRLEGMSLYKRAKDGHIDKGEVSERELKIFVPMGVMMIMFMAVMLSQYMLQSTIEEKQQRIAEVLLGSVSTFQLMAGKLLANLAVSLTVVFCYLTGGLIVAAYYDAVKEVPFHLIGWFLAFQALAVLLYGSIFGAVGASCSELKDAQGLLMPVMIVLMMPMFVWFAVLDEPNGGLATTLSLIPTMTPMLMPFRMSISPLIPVWQPIAGIIGVLVLATFCVFAAGRVFRIGILSQGKAPKLKELIGWVVRG
jgi:ABC-2 type transport system permease protein